MNCGSLGFLREHARFPKRDKRWKVLGFYEFIVYQVTIYLHRARSMVDIADQQMALKPLLNNTSHQITAFPPTPPK
jgi:hypothetical protein